MAVLTNAQCHAIHPFEMQANLASWPCQNPTCGVFGLFSGSFWQFLCWSLLWSLALDGVCPALLWAQPLHRGVSVLILA